MVVMIGNFFKTCITYRIGSTRIESIDNRGFGFPSKYFHKNNYKCKLNKIF
jgi:hypothetical protein